jgi:hypothetical protein
VHQRLTLIAVLLGTAPLTAQAIPFSQHGTVTQRVGITDITVEYSRPTARGRTLFPDVVAWGRIWTPGADSATRITFSRDVRINGEALAAGSYSIWLVPTPDAAWPVIFSRASAVYHQPYPGEAADALRLSVEPTTGDDVDTLTLGFPWVRPDHAILRIHWGTTMVSLRIDAPLPGD